MLKLTCFCFVYIECIVNDRATTFHVSKCEKTAGSPVQSVFQEHESSSRMFSSHILYLQHKARERWVKVTLTWDEIIYFLPFVEYRWLGIHIPLKKYIEIFMKSHFSNSRGRVDFEVSHLMADNWHSYESPAAAVCHPVLMIGLYSKYIAGRDRMIIFRSRDQMCLLAWQAQRITDINWSECS